MRVLSSTFRRCRAELLMALMVWLCFSALGCGASSMPATTTPSPTTPPTPAQPSYPSTPPVPITWSPSTSPLPAPPAEVPPPAGSDDFPLTVSSPTSGVTTTSPIQVVASAKPTNPIFFMRVYIDQLSVYFTFNTAINTTIFVASGQHTVEVMAEDNKGYISATLINITVTTQSPTAIQNIQTLPGWQSCSALFPPGSGRAGQICAAGLGTAVSTMTENQSTPSMDGMSAKFTLAGPTGYSNMLYFNPVAGGNNVSHFTYGLYFYIDNPDAAQALEFDTNQTFGGQRWVWGSECNFKGTGKWDIWNDLTGWQPTQFPCHPFPANTWIHLIWQLERVGNQVHYISLTVGNQVYDVDTYYPNQPNWTLEEIDTAFQMDGDYAQQPYDVWLDEVSLTAY
jgi:hypothetical protein